MFYVHVKIQLDVADLHVKAYTIYHLDFYPPKVMSTTAQ